MDLIIILIAIAFLAVIIAKPLFNKLNIPLSFSAMFIGMFLGLFPIWTEVANTDSFIWLANLGMLFMIFSMIFQMSKSNIKKDKHFAKYLLKSSIILLGLEFLILFPIIYFFLESNLLGALLISLIFTTVAEAMVIPFLKKFNIVNTKLGKSIIGIGVLDNVLEMSVILIASFASINGNLDMNSLIITVIVGLTAFLFMKFFAKTKYIESIINHLNCSSLFLLAVGTLFLFSGIFSIIHMEFIGAIIGAFVMKHLVKDVPVIHKEQLKKSLSTTSDGLFGPIFYLWVGLSTSLIYILEKPILAILLVVVGLVAKIIPSIIATKKDMNLHSSVILGIALKFGAGIIFIKLLFEKGIISQLTYTLTIAAILIYRLIIPFLLGHYINKWRKDIV